MHICVCARACVYQLKSVERYDPGKNEWELVANMGNLSCVNPRVCGYIPVSVSVSAFVYACSNLNVRARAVSCLCVCVCVLASVFYVCM